MEEKKEKQKHTKKTTETLETYKKERDEYLEGWKRAKADLINYKKEEAERLEMFAKFSNENIIREILPVLDSFDLAFKNIKEDDPVRAGVENIQNQLKHILKKAGLSPIEVSKGDTFNPTIHEALSEIISESPPGTIAEEVHKGYFFHDKVMRPAQVAVSKEKGQ